MCDQPGLQREESSHRGEESCCRGDGPLDAGEEPSVLLHKLKSTISKNVESKVEQILQAVQRFSDNDKLYLYLQLPSGPSTGDKSVGDSGWLSTADQLHTCTWIRSHLEEHSDTCLPKQDVYETYRLYCENLHQRPLSAANFGKIIRDIFPNIKARRLGGRGQSKYCYSGIRRKTMLNMPLLPSLDLSSEPVELTELVQTYKAEVTEAACQLICDWAQKILKRSFDTVVEVAHFLVQEHLVNPRCSQAALLASATLAGGPSKPNKVIKKISRETENITADVKREKEGESSSSSKPQLADKPSSSSSSSSLDAPPALGSSSSSSSLRPAGVRDLQVEALMKHLPRLLPRSSVPDKSPLALRSSPPSLAPKDASGVVGGGGGGVGVKVIAMATLPQQQGGAVPLVIVPQGCLSYGERDRVLPPPPPPATPTSVLQRARGGATKRPLEAGPVGGGGATPMPVKRKRGRPRKAPPPPPPTQHTSIITSLSGGVIQKASSSSSSSQQGVELVFQEPPPSRALLVRSSLEAANNLGAPTPLEGANVQGAPKPLEGTNPLRAPKPLRAPNPLGAPKPLLLLRGPPVSSGVEVIQRAPKPSNLNTAPPPPPLLQQEQAEVQISLTPTP